MPAARKLGCVLLSLHLTQTCYCAMLHPYSRLLIVTTHPYIAAGPIILEALQDLGGLRSESVTVTDQILARH